MKHVETCLPDKAEGRCLGSPYDTQLASIDGVVIHFWLEGQSTDLLPHLLHHAKRERDIVGATYSTGSPLGYWAHEDF